MNTATEHVAIELGDRSYEVVIGCAIISDLRSYESLAIGATAVIVTNEVVAPLYAEALRSVIQRKFRRVELVVLPDGEAHKDLATVGSVFDSLVALKCDRSTTLFALGGGVVGDMTGFAAACYMRGIPYVQVPTTLLAQVDSSVGGKTAVNHSFGKNLIGAFNQPARVVTDIDTLRTLPVREITAGLAEVIKCALIADTLFLDWMESHLQALKLLEAAALIYAIKRCCEIKARVVNQDERETGSRALLNFGHTFGHAIESGLGYGAWLHGEAVGCGMVMAADLSARLGMIDPEYALRVTRLIKAAGLPVRGPALRVDRYLNLMSLDKKAEDGRIRFVLLDSPGHAVVRNAPRPLVAQVIEDNTV